MEDIIMKDPIKIRKYIENRYCNKQIIPPPLTLEQIEKINKYDLDKYVFKFLTTVSSYDWLSELENGETELLFDTCDYLYDESNYVIYDITKNTVSEAIHDYEYEYSSFLEYIKELKLPIKRQGNLKNALKYIGSIHQESYKEKADILKIESQNQEIINIVNNAVKDLNFFDNS